MNDWCVDNLYMSTSWEFATKRTRCPKIPIEKEMLLPWHARTQFALIKFLFSYVEMYKTEFVIKKIAL